MKKWTGFCISLLSGRFNYCFCFTSSNELTFFIECSNPQKEEDLSWPGGLSTVFACGCSGQLPLWLNLSSVVPNSSKPPFANIVTRFLFCSSPECVHLNCHFNKRTCKLHTKRSFLNSLHKTNSLHLQHFCETSTTSKWYLVSYSCAWQKYDSLCPENPSVFWDR